MMRIFLIVPCNQRNRAKINGERTEATCVEEVDGSARRPSLASDGSKIGAARDIFAVTFPIAHYEVKLSDME